MSGPLRNTNLALGLAGEMSFPICQIQLSVPGNTFLECSYSIPTPQILRLEGFLAAELF